jgi:hypothetical protein
MEKLKYILKIHYVINYIIFNLFDISKVFWIIRVFKIGIKKSNIKHLGMDKLVLSICKKLYMWAVKWCDPFVRFCSGVGFSFIYFWIFSSVVATLGLGLNVWSNTDTSFLQQVILDHIFVVSILIINLIIQ